MHFLTKFRSLRAGIGLVDTCLYAVSRLADALFGTRVRIIKYYFMAQPVAAPGEPLVRTRAFAFEWADASSPVLQQAGRPAAVIADRFAQGARCLVAVTDRGELAGFLWFVAGPYVEDEVRVAFVPGPASAWDFDVTVLPRYRMGRLFGALWQRAHAELSAHGIRQTISRISAFNAGSLASHRRLGAREVGAAWFACIGPVQLMKSSIAPRWHLSWRDSQRPTLRFEA